MERPKEDPEKQAINIEQDPEIIPAEPVDTDDNDEPDANASGDSNDETESENEAGPPLPP